MNKLKIAILTLALTVGGVASAALLTTYVSHTGEAEISQAVTWGNGDTGNRTYTMTGVGGSTYTILYEDNWNIENNANNPVDVEIVTTIVDTNNAPGVWDDIDITDDCTIEHEVYGDGVDPNTNNPLIAPLPALSGNLPFSTEITLPVQYSGIFTITTSINPVIIQLP